MESAEVRVHCLALGGVALTSPDGKMTMQVRATCLSITRIHVWKMQALNALSFEVVYLADDSGETVETGHEVVKQPDGAWLFSR